MAEYVCPFCGARFATESELRTHMGFEHPPTPPPPVPPPPVIAPVKVELTIPEATLGDLDAVFRKVVREEAGNLLKTMLELEKDETKEIESVKWKPLYNEEVTTSTSNIKLIEYTVPTEKKAKIFELALCWVANAAKCLMTTIIAGYSKISDKTASVDGTAISYVPKRSILLKEGESIVVYVRSSDGTSVTANALLNLVEV